MLYPTTQNKRNDVDVLNEQLDGKKINGQWTFYRSWNLDRTHTLGGSRHGEMKTLLAALVV
jgi:hypothetical protein